MHNHGPGSYPECKTEIRVTVHKKGAKIFAPLINGSQGGFGSRADKVAFPGPEVDIAMNRADNCAIRVAVGWVLRIGRELDRSKPRCGEQIRKNVLLETAQ